MNELGDDLLDELQDLETSTSELEQQLEIAEQSNQIAQQHSAETAFQTAVLMLESSKLSQDGALQSQEAAQINLKLAREQQIQIEELHQANNNWRKSIDKANLELKTAKSFYISIFVISLLASLGIFATFGWSLYANNAKQQELQQEIVDIIQTEALINNRQLHAKLDEIQALLNPEAVALVQQNISQKQADNQNLVINLEQDLAQQLPADQLETQTASKAEIKADKAPVAIAAQDLSEQDLTELTALIEQTLAKQSQHLESTLNQLTRQAPAATSNNQALEQKLTRLEKLLNQQSASLQAISKQLESLAKPATRPGSVAKTTPAAKTSPAPVNQAQTQQLNKLQTEIQKLKQQQTSTEKTLQEVSKQIEQTEQKLSEEAKQPQPYSYRNPYEYRE